MIALMDIRSSSCAPTCLARIFICSFISPVRLRHYCASASFLLCRGSGLIAPSLEAVPLGPRPPLLIAAAGSSTSFGLLQPDAKSHTLNGTVIETHEHASEFKDS